MPARTRNPLLRDDDTPVPAAEATQRVLETVKAAERQLANPREFHLEWDEWDDRGYVYNGDGALDPREPEARQDAVLARWRRDFFMRLAETRRNSGPKVSRLRADLLEWGASYNRTSPVEGRHDRHCVKHDVCRVLQAYRHEAGRYHALAQTPYPDRPDDL